MPPRKYLVQVVWPRSGTCAKLFIVPWASICTLVYLVVCVVFGSKWTTRSQPCRSSKNSELLLSFWRMKVNFLPEFTGIYWLSGMKIPVNISTLRFWVIKSEILTEICTWTTSRYLKSLSAELTIWTGKHSTNLYKKIAKNQLWDLREDPKEAETNKSLSSGKTTDASSTW